MEKIHILSVSPYTGLNEIIMNVARDYPEIEVDLVQGNLDSAVEEIQKLGISQYTAIMSRGGTAAEMAKYFKIPVINISISIYDFMRAIKLSDNFTGKRAIVGFPNITKIAEKIIKDFSLTAIDIFTINQREEIGTLYEKLIKDEYRTIIGDVYACDSAKPYLLNTVLLTSGYESVINAFEEIIHLTKSQRYSQQQILLFQKIIQQSNQQVVIIDANDNIVYSSLSKLSLTNRELIALANSIIEEAFEIKDFENGTYKVSKYSYSILEARFFTLIFEQISRTKLSSSYLKVLNDNVLSSEDIVKSSMFRSYFHPYANISSGLNIHNLPILLTGEPGTGKDAFAFYTHNSSNNNRSPLIMLDCSKVPEDSWEDCLDFLSNMDHFPTLYLKRLQTIPLSMQEPLFEILQMLIKNRVRLIASANSDLQQLIEMVPMVDRLISMYDIHHVHISSLRENLDRFQELTAICINEANLNYGKQITGISEKGLRLMEQYSWPGNLSQLQRVINSLVLDTADNEISELSVSRELNAEDSQIQSREIFPDLNLTLEAATLQYMRLVLERENDNYSRAAAKLGISRTTLWRRIKEDTAGKTG